jgi:hypothetical protein
VSGWSLSEAGALAQKAARGAGMPWGLAEEAGHAALWLEARGAPGLAALAVRLEATAEGRDACLCPVALGTRLIDGAEAPPGAARLAAPLLLAPFLATIAGGGAWRLAAGEAVMSVSAGALALSGGREALLAADASCRLAPEARAPAAPPLNARVPESAAAAVARLGRFAARTYAPATEASRLAGAGAGVSDGD